MFKVEYKVKKSFGPKNIILFQKLLLTYNILYIAFIYLFLDLKFLDLSHNSIKTLHEMSFRHASNLTALILANNEISYIRERFFKGKKKAFLVFCKSNTLHLGNYIYSIRLIEIFFISEFICCSVLVFLKIYGNKFD